MASGICLTDLATDRLALEVLHVSHATEMFDVLADPVLYEFTGGTPPTLPELEERYRFQIAGSGRAEETWLNWIVRTTTDDTAVGFVQATATPQETAIAWTIGAPWQGQGYAGEAATAMVGWLASVEAAPPIAWIHPEHRASQAVARRVGLRPTETFDEDGEQRWV